MTGHLAGAVLVWPRAALARRPGRSAHAGRTILVTGASSGIGASTATLLGRAGATVLLLARSTDRLDAVASGIRSAGGIAHVYVCDLTQPDAVAATAADILADHGRVDGIVSNAGRSMRRSIHRSAERDDLGRSIAVNVTGPAQLLLALLPRLVEQPHAAIVNVSTVSAKPPPAPGWGAYQASKTAFDVWLRAAAAELRGTGVRVRTVYMPLVTTPMSSSTEMYARMPSLSAEQAARIVVGALGPGRARVAPWWLRWQELAAFVAPNLIERVLHSRLPVDHRPGTA